MRYGVVYRVTCLETDKCYIGRTKRPLYERWYSHCHRSSNCLYLKHAIEKYGKDSFSIEEIASSWDGNSLKELEVLLIKQENTLAPNGYNLINTSRGVSEVSEATRQKMREASTGRIYSVESRQKISAARKGIVFSEAHLQNLRKSRKGRIYSEETRQKLSIAGKERLHSEESKQKMRNAQKGHIYSEQSRQKMSESAKRRVAKNRICSET